MAKLFIGTSGWIYKDWEGIFYPQDLPSKDKLKYFSQYFKTTEVNYSFYHLPRPKTYQNWHSQTPKDFIFSVKASRFITHIKRLKGIGEAWRSFLKNALNLKEKLGPILFQFPPSFQASPENIKRLEKFLSILRGRTSIKISISRGSTSKNLRYAFEFRHPSWCDKKIYNLLKRFKAAWVIADSSQYPKSEAITADFIYMRMHGSQVLFGSKYTKKELKELTRKIKKWLSLKKDVYIYFNNDAYGYAVQNAQELLKLLK